MKKDMLAKVMGGLLDSRLKGEERDYNLRYLQIRWAKGMLGPMGDWVWNQAVDYVTKYRETMTFKEIKLLLDEQGVGDPEVIYYCIAFTNQDTPCTTSQFKHAANHLERQHNQSRFLAAISKTMTIFEHGVKVKGTVIKGYLGAKRYLVDSLRTIEEKGSTEDFVNLRDVKDLQLSEKDIGNNIQFGFSPIDDLTGGGQFGEFALIASYTNEGKSQFLVNVAWNAVVNHRKNVIVYNGEMADEQYKRRLVCRHSHHPKFGIKGGLVYDDVKFGRLGEKEQVKLEEVKKDFSENPEYGKLFIHGLGSDDNALNIWQSVEALGTLRIDMVAVDYLGLVPAYQKRHSRREELSETIRAFKRFAQGAYNGDGIFVLAAYQMNRSGRDRAAEQGHYDLQALEETAEAEKASDVIIWLLQTEELEEASEVKIGVMKSRDSGKLPEAYLFADYATCYLADVTG